jgi:hypothetical protein
VDIRKNGSIDDIDIAHALEILRSQHLHMRSEAGRMSENQLHVSTLEALPSRKQERRPVCVGIFPFLNTHNGQGPCSEGRKG